MAGSQCGNDRNRGVCNEFYRLQAVTFSLFRHPPRGGSADATFPRWGKEMAAADSPDMVLDFGVAARRAVPGAPYKEILRFRRKNVNGDGECEEKDKCPENLDAPLFLHAFCVRLCGMDDLFDSCGFQMSQKNRLR
ncbi:MAG: hypothetical protein IJF88_00360 [Oscillospiraceae bacterium]|nr:hypothetical protein [Oscillospiraceae bacterium]